MTNEPTGPRCVRCLLPIRRGWIGWYHAEHLPVTNHRARPIKDTPR